MTNEWQRPFTGPEMDLAPGSVFASRWWALSGYGWLSGAYGGQWEPGVENVAHCRAPVSTTVTYDPSAILVPQAFYPPRHRSPDDTCTCGFYAYWSTNPQIPFMPTPNELSVLGVIEGYGRCLIGEKGLRCEKARIRGVWLGNVPSFQIIQSVDYSTTLVESPYRYDVALQRSARQRFERNGIPVHSSKAELFAAHPLTTDYLPKPQEPATPEPLPSDS